MSIRRAIGAVFLTVAAAVGLTAQGGRGANALPVAPRTAVLSGQLLDAGTGRPVPQATVTLRISAPGPTPPNRPAPQPVITGAYGQFVFTNVAQGTYQVVATKTGYLDGWLGARSPSASGTP